jgi:hypothetical protein
MAYLYMCVVAGVRSCIAGILAFTPRARVYTVAP